MATPEEIAANIERSHAKRLAAMERSVLARSEGKQARLERNLKEHRGYTVEQELPLEVVLAAIPKGLNDEQRHKFEGGKSDVKIATSRLVMYKKYGVKCTLPGCQRKGHIWRVESSGGNGMHLNLYTEDGIMMTQDHTKPKCMGGKDVLKNKRPMCAPCNHKKGKLSLDEYLASRK